MPSKLGVKINELRRQKGLTLEQLAQSTDSSKSYMWEIENKEVARPSAEKLDRIAEALGVNERTGRRDWEKARLLLAAAMREQ